MHEITVLLPSPFYDIYSSVVVDNGGFLKNRKFHLISSNLVSKCSACSNEENKYPHFMFLTANNEVMGVARCQTMPHIRHCYITNPTRTFVEQDDERLCVISSEAGNQAMI